MALMHVLTPWQFNDLVHLHHFNQLLTKCDPGCVVYPRAEGSSGRGRRDARALRVCAVAEPAAVDGGSARWRAHTLVLRERLWTAGGVLLCRVLAWRSALPCPMPAVAPHLVLSAAGCCGVAGVWVCVSAPHPRARWLVQSHRQRQCARHRRDLLFSQWQGPVLQQAPRGQVLHDRRLVPPGLRRRRRDPPGRGRTCPSLCTHTTHVHP